MIARAFALLLLFASSGCSKRHRFSPEKADAPAVAQKNLEVEVAELTAEFQRANDDVRQVEIVQQLAINSTPAARAQLELIYRRTQSPPLKTAIIEALAFVDSDNLDPSLALLRDAVAPGQPVELRDAAIGTLRDLNDLATLPVWKLLLQDADADRREAAQQAVEYYSIFEKQP